MTCNYCYQILMEHGGKLHKENKLNYKKFQCTFKKFYEINVLGLVA
jgi:hypothetical protein